MKDKILLFLLILIILFNLSSKCLRADIKKYSTFEIGFFTPCIYLRSKNYLSKSNFLKYTAIKANLNISDTSVNTNKSKYDVDICYIWGYSIGILQHFTDRIKAGFLIGKGRNINVPNTDTYVADDSYQYHYEYQSLLFSYYFSRYLEISLGVNFCEIFFNNFGVRFVYLPEQPSRRNDLVFGIKSNLHEYINLEINYSILFERIIGGPKSEVKKNTIHYLYLGGKCYFTDHLGINIEMDFPLRKVWKNEDFRIVYGLVLRY